MTTKNTKRTSGNGGGAPPPLSNRTNVEQVLLSSLKSNPHSARTFSAMDERTARQILDALPLIPLLLIDNDGTILVGEIVFRAARELGLKTLNVVRVHDLSEAELQALSIAYQRLGELGAWDRAQLVELNLRFEVEIPNYKTEHIGFEVTTIDLMAAEFASVQTDAEQEEEEPSPEIGPAGTQVGDVWHLGKHRIVCGDSTQPSVLTALMSGAGKAAVMFTDPPFGCPIGGFVARKGAHREFVMGSGEMSRDELSSFFGAFIANAIHHLKAGAVVEIVIDWRSLSTLMGAAEPLLGPLINFAVWAKDRPGQGSFLRSQHELVLIFKVGKGRFLNNVQLGRHGRNRSNLWAYPSAKTASTGSDEGNMLANHPTPKPVRLVADAILDCTRRGDIVLDLFLGSGTTLIAAEKVGRVCNAVELDPLYVDLAIRRWQAWTGEEAVHAASGRTFDDIATDHPNT